MALIDSVKRKLNITWSDADTDARVVDIMEDAAPKLRHRLGISDESFDFNKAGQERTLFLALCLYMWNHSEDAFPVNYSEAIAQCRAVHIVAQIESGGESDAEE